MEIMASIILYGFIAFVIGGVGKLIYEVQQNKKREKEADELCKTEAEFEAKDRFQKLAGIGQPKNELDPEIWKYVADKVSKEGFPEPDPSIPVVTAKITTIDTKFEETDPLSSVPISRVSKQAKKKMAEIAKEDINKQLEQTAEKFATLFPNELQSELPKEIKDAMLNAPILKPKKKPNPKQMDGKKAEGEFKKTRKKTTKKKVTK
jgi:hypothetical protein